LAFRSGAPASRAVSASPASPRRRSRITRRRPGASGGVQQLAGATATSGSSVGPGEQQVRPSDGARQSRLKRREMALRLTAARLFASLCCLLVCAACNLDLLHALCTRSGACLLVALAS